MRLRFAHIHGRRRAPALHRAREIAADRGTSLSSVLVELTTRGLGQLDEPIVLTTDPVPAFPDVILGRRVTVADGDCALDDE